MAKISQFTDDALAALKRDHERLRYEVHTLRTMLRAFMSGPSDKPYKPVCKFTLTAALATTDASKSATIDEQLGYGRPHLDANITVQNFATKTRGLHQYHGATGNKGKAYYNPSDKTWHIFDMECHT